MKLSAPIHILKSQAKEIKRAEGISLSEALNRIAQREGFNTWSLLQSLSADLLPKKREDLLGYFHPGDLVLIGARPSAGKTNLAISIFVQAIQQSEAKHWLFTLSEIHKDIARRIGVYDESIGTNDDKFELDYSDNINANYIIERTRNEVSSRSIIVIDYLQLLDHKRSNATIQEQVSSLRTYAKEKGCILLFISQLDRETKQRTYKRPSIDDIKRVNPLDLTVFNKILLLHRDHEHFHEAEAILARPVEHSFKMTWDENKARFS